MRALPLGLSSGERLITPTGPGEAVGTVGWLYGANPGICQDEASNFPPTDPEAGVPRQPQWQKGMTCKETLSESTSKCFMPTIRFISFTDPTFFSLKTHLVMGQRDHPQFTGLAQPGSCKVRDPRQSPEMNFRSSPFSTILESFSAMQLKIQKRDQPC